MTSAGPKAGHPIKYSKPMLDSTFIRKVCILPLQIVVGFVRLVPLRSTRLGENGAGSVTESVSVIRWLVLVTNGDKVILLTENRGTYIPLGTTQRLANPGKVPLEIIEVQPGSSLGEDDIVRFADTYGRVAPS
jgi:hypothetical protein